MKKLIEIPLPPEIAIPVLKVILEVIPEVAVVEDVGEVHLRKVIAELIEYIALLESQRTV